MNTAAVVPCWNARERIEAVVEALRGQVDVVACVDNGSDDGTADWIEQHAPDVLLDRHAANRGYPAAVNRGFDLVANEAPDSVALVNDDAVFLPGAVAALVDVLERLPGAGAASAKTLYTGRPGVLNGTGGAFDPDRALAALRGEGEVDRGQYDGLPEVAYPSGAASLLRWRAVQEVGSFDEAYYLYFEDADWGLRARALGWATVFAPRARVMHEGSAGTRSDPARRRYYNVRNRLLLANRYASPQGRRRAWLETLSLAAKQPARWPDAHRRSDAEAVWWGVLDHLMGRYGARRGDG